MATNQLEPYRCGGAHAMVLLHERHMRFFVRTWRSAKSSGTILPETDDPHFQSMETLLAHPLRSAGGYMTWMCESLGLPDPGIETVPEVDEIEEQAEDYLEHLLERWRLPLADVPPDRFDEPVYPSRWGVDYCIEAMIEHAVMHPIRHEFQLANLIEQQRRS